MKPTRAQNPLSSSSAVDYTFYRPTRSQIKFTIITKNLLDLTLARCEKIKFQRLYSKYCLKSIFCIFANFFSVVRTAERHFVVVLVKKMERGSFTDII